jgi:hypothetical protein
MKNIILPVVLGFLLSGCSLLNFLNPKQSAALKITTTPQATVFIDGKHSGTTPYLDEKLEPGEITLKLVPEQASEQASPFEGLVELTGGVITVINHQFATDQNSANGELLTLQPNNRSIASLSVVSQPDGSSVRVDGEAKGFTPLVIDQIDPGDHQMLITSPGYLEKTINIKTEIGYRLTVSAQLGKLTTPPATEKTTSDQEATKSAEKNNESAETKPTPSATSKNPTPTPTKKAAIEQKTPEKPYVKINDTPTGWLRVRSEPSLSGEEVAKVNPGETYSLKDEQSGWYQIELKDGELGWIAGQYAEKYK